MPTANERVAVNDRNELLRSKLRGIKKLNLSQGRHPRTFLSGVQSEHPWIPARSMRE